MGAWGDYEKGWGEVALRYDWAASRFEESGATEPAAMSLRVTHLFRKEQGEWKLLHRHADPLMSKTAAAAVLGAAER
jgi:ketosteroid isomerase-like protein